MPQWSHMPPEVTLQVDGVVVRARAGVSVAAALAQVGHVATRHSLSGEPRAAFCGMGLCFECRVRIDGVERLACLTPVRDGLQISTGERNSDG